VCCIDRLKPQSTASVHEKSNKIGSNGTQLTLPVQVGNASGIAVLDTGSSDTRINSAFLRAASIDPSSPKFHDAEPIFGANSKAMPSREGSIGTVTFAGIEVRDAEARVGPAGFQIIGFWG